MRETIDLNTELLEVLKEVSDYFAYKCRSDCPFSLCEGRRCDIYPVKRKVRVLLEGGVKNGRN